MTKTDRELVSAAVDVYEAYGLNAFGEYLAEEGVSPEQAAALAPLVKEEFERRGYKFNN